MSSLQEIRDYIRKRASELYDDNERHTGADGQLLRTGEQTQNIARRVHALMQAHSCIELAMVLEAEYAASTTEPVPPMLPEKVPAPEDPEEPAKALEPSEDTPAPK